MLIPPVSAGGLGRQLLAKSASIRQAVLENAALLSVAFLKRTKDLLVTKCSSKRRRRKIRMQGLSSSIPYTGSPWEDSVVEIAGSKSVPPFRSAPISMKTG